jgi:hypothetical protein
MRSSEYEWELEGEFEGELEYEGEAESEAFFARLAGLAARAVRSPTLRRVARSAAQGAVRSGLAAMGPGGANIGNMLGGLLGGQAEGECEGEGECESEGLNPIRRVYPDAMMEHLGHAAATARTEAEAEAFLGALIPIAARLIPRVAPTIMRAAPALIRGVANVGRTLLRSPTVRPLVQAVPGIVRGTVRDIAGQVARGQAVSGRAAVQTLARNTYRTLSDPRRAVQAYRRSRAVDRRYHRTPGAVTACGCNRAR